MQELHLERKHQIWEGRIWSEPKSAQIRCDASDLMFLAKNEPILALDHPMDLRDDRKMWQNASDAIIFSTCASRYSTSPKFVGVSSWGSNLRKKNFENHYFRCSFLLVLVRWIHIEFIFSIWIPTWNERKYCISRSLRSRKYQKIPFPTIMRDIDNFWLEEHSPIVWRTNTIRRR